jgi:hypothetical protein
VEDLLKSRVVPAAEGLVWAEYPLPQDGADPVILPYPLGLGVCEKVGEVLLALQSPVRRAVNFLKELIRQHGEAAWACSGQKVLSDVAAMMRRDENARTYLRDHRGEVFFVTSHRLMNHGEDSVMMMSLRNLVHASEQCFAVNDAGVLGLKQFDVLDKALHRASIDWNAKATGYLGDHELQLGMERAVLGAQGVNLCTIDNKEDSLLINVGVRGFKETVYPVEEEDDERVAAALALLASGGEGSFPTSAEASAAVMDESESECEYSSDGGEPAAAAAAAGKKTRPACGGP